MNIGQRPRQGSGAQVVVISAGQSGLAAARALLEHDMSDLQARPVYHHLRDSIEAHLTIVFAALAVSCWIEHQTGWSIRRFVKTARRYRTIQIQAGPQTITAADPCLTTSARPSARSTARPVRTNLAQLRLRAGRRGAGHALPRQRLGPGWRRQACKLVTCTLAVLGRMNSVRVGLIVGAPDGEQAQRDSSRAVSQNGPGSVSV